MVFFSGTLQEGISTALQQSKLVVCFVTDDKEESKRWESEYLTNETIAPLLGNDAVALRLVAGSEEAGYLAAIFPLPKTPTVVVIKNGQLKEYVSAGTSKEDFVSRVSKAFADQTGPQTSTAPIAQAEASTTTSAAVSNNTTNNPSSAQTSSSVQAPVSSTTEHRQGATQAQLLAEAERRRQVARKEREEMEKERRRKEKGKMPASQDPKDDAVKKASQQLAEKQRKAREDKARVLKLIEDDKAERRARSERQRAERQASVTENVSDTASGATVAPSSPATRRHDQCAIQVRLFDGSTIRTRFPAKATISQDVRKWIDENRTDGIDPYTFKIILTPLPNKAIDHATEEDKTLEELGLAPSSTLVLTPVDRYSSAYTSMNAGLTNPVSRFVTAVLAFLVNILGGITGALGGLGHDGTAVNSTEEGSRVGTSQNNRVESQGQAAASGRDGSGRIKGFQNPDDEKKDHQLYNGNSVSQVPHPT